MGDESHANYCQLSDRWPLVEAIVGQESLTRLFLEVRGLSAAGQRWEVKVNQSMSEVE